MSNILKCILMSMLLSSLGAQALPLPRAPRSLVQIPSTLMMGYDFEGIVELSNCSGSLIRFETSKDTDLALILTNGHCYENGFTPPGQSIYDRPSSRGFNLMDAQGNTAGRLQASRVVYTTMTLTDITIYKVTETYAQILQNYGVRAFTLSSKHPTIGTSVQVISGYWQRGYSCSIEAFVNELQEDGYSDKDSVRYSRPGCEVIGGTSGSPIIQTGTRTVIAINNTGNEDGQRCTMNNPCEIDSNGNVSFQKGFSYGQQTYLIYSCVDAKNEIKMTTPGCLLPH
jgi:V8-like Glu-specific endopeptidase